ncbi:General secretion pathway protein E [hydrothermal vent metagenome]|uniref:protein-secreting ATPase n=1 Tax=hydrothermal vent metagenome TaxID=652676 RepID=A0A1W1E0D9_9ZZZZ|nr:type II secretion system protein GspE [Gammaproteobacteria bacterium]
MTNSTLLPFTFAKKFSILLESTDDLQTLTYHQLPKAGILTEIQRKFGDYQLNNITLEQLRKKIQQSYEFSSVQNLDHFQDNAESDETLDALAMELHEPLELLNSDDEAPIIRLLNALFAQAILEQASDIHIESYEDRIRVRIRVNGTLKQVLEPNAKIAPLLVSRIKIMAKLDIAEKRLPQDGRIAIQLGGRAVDMRVSTIPSGHGEKVVLRLLDKQAGRLQLKQLGMLDSTYSAMRHLIHQPHGILLVTGPTGSGKTTTLYASLIELNNADLNITTIEDPIEYFIDGINQTQINNKVDMTFARGLRAILRQDPDIVMIGEIRDSETAQIAVQASLTGHLVFSTLHTNTAVGAITRLRDMGVEPFLLSSSLSGVLAQRLIRTLCSQCKQAHTTDTKEQEKLNINTPVTIYQAGGCDDCNHTGYQGRSGLYELLVINADIKSLIHNQASEAQILAASNAHSTLLEQAKQLVLSGDTSLDEAVRVVFL